MKLTKHFHAGGIVLSYGDRMICKECLIEGEKNLQKFIEFS